MKRLTKRTLHYLGLFDSATDINEMMYALLQITGGGFYEEAPEDPESNDWPELDSIKLKFLPTDELAEWPCALSTANRDRLIRLRNEIKERGTQVFVYEHSTMIMNVECDDTLKFQRIGRMRMTLLKRMYGDNFNG